MMKTLIFLIPLLAVKVLKADVLSLGMGLVSPSLQLVLEDSKSADSPKELQFSPNQAGNTALVFQYENIGFGLNLRNELREDKEAVPFESNYQDYQFRIFGQSSSYGLSYQSYKGYYIENASDFDSNLGPSSSEVLFPQLKTTNFLFSYLYNFNPKELNLEAAFGIGELQKSSGGSWLAGGFFSRQEMNSEKSLTPSFTGAIFSELQDIYSLKQLSLGISGGYSHMWYRKGYFFSALVMTSLAYQKQEAKFIGVSQVDKSEVTANRLFVNLGAGYNVEFHKIALNVYTTSIRTSIGDGGIRTTSVDVGLLYTYRMAQKNIPILSEVSAWFD